MKNEFPTWHKQAIEKGIDYIVLVYEKAEGFVFCPSNLEKPFRVGGDYDGNWHVTADGVIPPLLTTPKSRKLSLPSDSCPSGLAKELDGMQPLGC